MEKERDDAIWLYLLQSSPTITPSIDPHERVLFPLSTLKFPTHVVDLVKLPSKGNSKSALSFADNYIELFEEIRGALEAENQKYKQLADWNRRPKSFQVGNR